MSFIFYKYQGTGNDFIIFDNRDGKISSFAKEKIHKLCDRRFGIGADGLMLLENKTGYDFSMIYYNSDGNESSMCGNGGRCIVEFARSLGIIKQKTKFLAIDGEHEAIVIDNGFVSLKMNDVNTIEINNNFFFLNTGSPHYVSYVKNVKEYNVFEEGRKIRNSDRFKKEGTNVNFIEKVGDDLFVRTYERGVEAETYSCGTGVTAAALVASLGDKTFENIKTLGGNLKVKYTKTIKNTFSDIWLEGAATFVFKGEINL